MRSLLRQKLIADFKRELQERLPQFTLVDSEGRVWTWAWKMACNLTFFVFLQAYEAEDQFIVEVAWSEDGDFPWRAMGEIKIEKAEGRDRLGRLWKRHGDEPLWDLAPEQTAALREHWQARGRREAQKYPPDPPLETLLPRVEPLVRDAVRKLEQYGIPLFRKVAEIRKYEWPS